MGGRFRSYFTTDEDDVFEESIPSWSEILGTCAHCGEKVWQHDDPGECRHGIAHGQCLLDAGCEIA